MRILPSYGATEAKVPEIVHVLMESLAANRSTYEDPTKRKAVEELTILLPGAIDPRGRVLVKLDVPAELPGPGLYDVKTSSPRRRATC